jgi:hypothetical protein
MDRSHVITVPLYFFVTAAILTMAKLNHKPHDMTHLKYLTRLFVKHIL